MNFSQLVDEGEEALDLGLSLMEDNIVIFVKETRYECCRGAMELSFKVVRIERWMANSYSPTCHPTLNEYTKSGIYGWTKSDDGTGSTLPKM